MPPSNHFRRNWSRSMKRKFFPANSGHQNESGIRYSSLNKIFFVISICFWVAPIDPLPPKLIPLDEEEIFSGKFRSPKWIWNKIFFVISLFFDNFNVFGSPPLTHFRRNWSHSMRRNFFTANSGHQNMNLEQFLFFVISILIFLDDFNAWNTILLKSMPNFSLLLGPHFR